MRFRKIDRLLAPPVDEPPEVDPRLTEAAKSGITAYSWVLGSGDAVHFENGWIERVTERENLLIKAGWMHGANNTQFLTDPDWSWTGLGLRAGNVLLCGDADEVAEWLVRGLRTVKQAQS